MKLSKGNRWCDLDVTFSITPDDGSESEISLEQGQYRRAETNFAFLCVFARIDLKTGILVLADNW